MAPAAAPFAEIEDMLTDATFDLLSNAVVTPAAGTAFNGIFSVSDRDAFDAAQVGDYTLRYPVAAATLQAGDRLTISGQAYRVADHPRRIGDGREAVVALMDDRP